MLTLRNTALLATALACIGTTPAANANEGYDHGTADWEGTCATGLVQSPVDVVTSKAARTSSTFRPSYTSFSAANVVNVGHTIRVDVPAGSGSLTLGSKRYELVQFHVHAASENFVNGEQYPLEMHLVHRATDGTLAVLGVFFDAGAPNAQLAQVLQAIPAEEGHTRAISGFNIAALVPTTGSAYRFGGSLTTPPCSEGVAWNVMSKPKTASLQQLAAFAARFSGHEFPAGNRRPVQSHYGRGFQYNLLSTETGDSRDD